MTSGNISRPEVFLQVIKGFFKSSRQIDGLHKFSAML